MRATKYKIEKSKNGTPDFIVEVQPGGWRSLTLKNILGRLNKYYRRNSELEAQNARLREALIRNWADDIDSLREIVGDGYSDEELSGSAQQP